MLRALLAGEQDAKKLAELALGRLREKIPQLLKALEGCCTEHHRWVLGRLLAHLGYLEGQLEQFDGQIARRLDEVLDKASQERLDGIPGVNRKTIENVIAEIGVEMKVFPDAGHLCSWCGICPGNEESAGKRLSSRARKGNRWLRRALTEAAWAASHTKETYLSAHYRRLAQRRGKKRALLAVGHTLLVVIYHMLKEGKEYQDLGPDYYEKLEPARLRRYLVRRLQGLGYDVTLVPQEGQASTE
jgi:transposase